MEIERMGGGVRKRKKVVIDGASNNLICYQPEHAHLTIAKQHGSITKQTINQIHFS